MCCSQGAAVSRAAFASNSPTGNIDLAPTILHLLGIAATDAMDGRILRESLTDGDAVDWQTTTHRAERSLPDGVYRQSITVSQVGETVYVDEGQAELA